MPLEMNLDHRPDPLSVAMELYSRCITGIVIGGEAFFDEGHSRRSSSASRTVFGGRSNAIIIP
jgi:hypothetical protein